MTMDTIITPVSRAAYAALGLAWIAVSASAGPLVGCRMPAIAIALGLG